MKKIIPNLWILHWSSCWVIYAVRMRKSSSWSKYSLLYKNCFWLGEAVTNTELEYLGSTYGAKSAPATQKELIERVNQTIDRCMEYMCQNIEKDKRVHVSASLRMNCYIQNTDFGEYIQNRYPQLFGTHATIPEKEMI